MTWSINSQAWYLALSSCKHDIVSDTHECAVQNGGNFFPFSSDAFLSRMQPIRSDRGIRMHTSREEERKACPTSDKFLFPRPKTEASRNVKKQPGPEIRRPFRPGAVLLVHSPGIHWHLHKSKSISTISHCTAQASDTVIMALSGLERSPASTCMVLVFVSLLPGSLTFQGSSSFTWMRSSPANRHSPSFYAKPSIISMKNCPETVRFSRLLPKPSTMGIRNSPGTHCSRFFLSNPPGPLIQNLPTTWQRPSLALRLTDSEDMGFFAENATKAFGRFRGMRPKGIPDDVENIMQGPTSEDYDEEDGLEFVRCSNMSSSIFSVSLIWE